MRPTQLARTTPERPSSGVPLLAAGALALTAGLVHRSSGAVALGAVLLAAPGVVRLLLGRALAAITVRRRAPSTAFEGDEVEVAIELENRGALPLFQPVVSDGFGPELRTRKEVVFGARVEPRETARETYRASCILPRGVYGLGPITIALSDPLGWFRVERTVLDGDAIRIFPAVRRLGARDDLGRAVSWILTETQRGGPGTADEFWAVREYRHGDPPRRVHWRLTAHRGWPVVREFTRPTSGDLCIFVDRAREALIGIGRGSSLEHAVKVAAAAAAHALAQGHRVQLIAGSEERFRVPPATGREAIRSFLEVLVHVRPESEERLPGLIASHARSARPGAVALVPVSPYLQHDEEFLPALTAARSAGVRPVALVFDAGTFRRLWSPAEPETDSQEFAARLRGAGVHSLLLPCAADLEAVFAEETT